MLSADDYRDKKHICKEFPNCPRGASRTFAHGAADVARRMAAHPAPPPGAEGRVLEAPSNVKTPRGTDNIEKAPPVAALPGVPTTPRQLAATEREHRRDADSTHHATDTTELNAEDCLPKDLLDKTPSPTLAYRVPHPLPTQHHTDVDVCAWYETTVAWVAETDKTLQVHLPPVPPPPSNLAPNMLPYSFEEWCARLMRWHTIVIGNFSAPQQQQEALPPTMCSMYTYPNPWQPTAGNAVMPQYYGAMRPPMHMGIKQPMLAMTPTERTDVAPAWYPYHDMPNALPWGIPAGHAEKVFVGQIPHSFTNVELASLTSYLSGTYVTVEMAVVMSRPDGRSAGSGFVYVPRYVAAILWAFNKRVLCENNGVQVCQDAESMQKWLAENRRVGRGPQTGAIVFEASARRGPPTPPPAATVDGLPTWPPKLVAPKTSSWPPSVDPQKMAAVPQVKTYEEEYPPLAVVATKTAPPNEGAKAASHESKGPTPPRPNDGKHAPPSATMKSGPGPQVMANSSGPLTAAAFMECPFGEWCNISKSEHVRAYHLPGWTPKRFEN